MAEEVPAGASAPADRAPSEGAYGRPRSSTHPSRRTGFMALLEVLRAPLLLSPLSDVAAGWAVTQVFLGAGNGGLGARHSDFPLAFFAAAACGVCLLGAGMAQNALADRQDDEARKPDRPLPRGALSSRSVQASFILLNLGALGASLLAPGTLPVMLAIVVLTTAYHLLLKPVRLAGCAALGALRGLDMALGAAAAAGGLGPLLEWPSVAFSPVVVCGAYALYVAGASLHASTDDEQDGALWSRSGLSLCTLTLVALGWIATAAPDAESLAALLFGYALVRLLNAWRTLPPPPLTGVALSTMYLVGAGLCLGAGHSLLGAVILVLFLASRRLMRVFPPS